MTNEDDIASIFDTESESLFSTVSNASTKTEFSLSEIIQIYYQIINVSSLCKTLSQKFENMDGEQHPASQKVEETRRFISDEFDSHLHPVIGKYLDGLIANVTKKLQSSGSAEKSKDGIESEAKMYEQLRETMSTKEFVDQYQKGLASDD